MIMKKQMKRKSVWFSAAAILICTLIVFLLVPPISASAAVWDGTTVASEFAGGSGTKEDPYKIANGEQLALFSLYYNAYQGHNEMYFILMSDIDLGGHEIAPVGEINGGISPAFNGVFDGAGYTISGVNIKSHYTYRAKDESGDFNNENDAYYGGLFAAIGTSGIVRNLTVRGDIGLSDDSYGNVFLGGIAGYVNGGTIENCLFVGTVNSTSDYSDNSYFGGIAGYADAAEINLCVSSCDINISGENGYVHKGGIYGGAKNNICSVNRCFSSFRDCTVGALSDWEIGLGDSASVAESLNNYIETDLDIDIYSRWYPSVLYDYPTHAEVTSGEIAKSLGTLGGTGVSYDPYIIDSAEDFELLARVVNFGYNTNGLCFKQTADIAFGTFSDSDGDGTVDDGEIKDTDGNSYKNTNYALPGDPKYNELKRYARDTYYRLYDKSGFASIFENYTPSQVYLECDYFKGFFDEYMTRFHLADISALADHFETNVINVYYNSDWESTYQSGMIMDVYTGTFFRGSYDGGGYDISGLYCKTVEYGGLFGATLGAYITNVNIRDSYFNSTNGTGVIAGYAEHRTTVSNCAVYTSAVTGTYKSGGIIGYARDNITVRDCRTSSDVYVFTDSSGAGGIVGNYDGDGGSVINCTSNAAVSADEYATCVGGIVGSTLRNLYFYVGELEIKYCHNTGSVSGGRDDIGGIIGYTDKVYLFACTNTGDVTNPYGNEYWGNAGGIVGTGISTVIEECNAACSVTIKNSTFVPGMILGGDNGWEETVCSVLGCKYLSADGEVAVGYSPIGQPKGNFEYSDYRTENGIPVFDGMWDGSVASAYNGGDGSAETPYEIANGEQLAYFAAQVNGGETYVGKYLVLTADIDLSYILWTPIGTGTNGFEGVLDGAGHTVCGLYVYSRKLGEGSPVVGFFYQADSSGNVAEVRNLIIKGNIIGISEGANHVYAGGFVGAAWGEFYIYNCAFYGTVEAIYNDVFNDGYTHSNCYAGAFGGYSGLWLDIQCCFTNAIIRTAGDSPKADTYLGYGYGNPSNCYYASTINGEFNTDLTDGKTEAAALNAAQSSLTSGAEYSTWYGTLSGLSFTETALDIFDELAVLGGEGLDLNPYIVDSKEDLALIARLVNEGHSLKGLYFLQTADISYGYWQDNDGDGLVDSGEIYDYDGGYPVTEQNFTPIGGYIPERHTLYNNESNWTITSKAALASFIAEKGIDYLGIYINGTNDFIDGYLRDLMLKNGFSTEDELVDYIDDYITENIPSGYAQSDDYSSVIIYDYSECKWFSGNYSVGFNEDRREPYYISGLYAVCDSYDYCTGVFGAIMGADISGLCVEESYFKTFVCTGAAVGYSLLSNIRDCSSFDIGIDNQYEGGGIVGYAEISTVSSCYASGIHISATGGYSGGIAGNIKASSIINCTSYAVISADADGSVIGGIVGYAREISLIMKCTAYGSVTGVDSVGGIVGYMSGTEIIDSCAVDMVITGRGSGDEFETYGVGGIVGTAQGTIENCYVRGTSVDGDLKYTGAVCGAAGYDLTIINCYYEDESETDSLDGTTFKTPLAFKSGEVAWLLNTSGKNEGEDGYNHTGIWTIHDGDIAFTLPDEIPTYKATVTGAKSGTYYTNCYGEIPQLETVSGEWTSREENGYGGVFTADFAITSVHLKLGASLTMIYSANIKTSIITENPQMEFIMNEKFFTVDGVAGEPVGDYTPYTFDFTEISPQCMGDLVSAELTIGDKTAMKTDYSIQEYCNKMLLLTPDEIIPLIPMGVRYERFKSLVSDILVYGARAQIYKNYNCGDFYENLVDNGVIGTEYTPMAAEESDRRITVIKNKDCCFSALGLWFDNVNRIYWKISVSDENISKVVVNIYKGYDMIPCQVTPIIKIGSGEYIVYSEDIMSTGFDDVYKAVITYDGVEIQSAQYSVKSYVISMQGKTGDIAYLVRSLYNYGRSSMAYLMAE